MKTTLHDTAQLMCRLLGLEFSSNAWSAAAGAHAELCDWQVEQAGARGLYPRHPAVAPLLATLVCATSKRQVQRTSRTSCNLTTAGVTG